MVRKSRGSERTGGVKGVRWEGELGFPMSLFIPSASLISEDRSPRKRVFESHVDRFDYSYGAGSDPFLLSNMTKLSSPPGFPWSIRSGR